MTTITASLYRFVALAVCACSMGLASGQTPATPKTSKPPRPKSAAVAPAGTAVIMEFSDLQCPDSARYNMGLKNTVLQRYVNSGQASYQWHDFPLPMHDHAIEAACAARCAGAAADTVRHQIMANQADMTPGAYARYAREAGVDGAGFANCARNGKSRTAVMADQALGQKLGVRGTPTLVLGISDGQGNVKPAKIVKAYDPPQQVLAAIDQFLAAHPAPQPKGQ